MTVIRRGDDKNRKWRVCPKVSPYVYGRTFTASVDHKPLLFVENLKETSARGTKRKEFLAGSSFEIVFAKRMENVI